MALTRSFSVDYGACHCGCPIIYVHISQHCKMPPFLLVYLRLVAFCRYRCLSFALAKLWKKELMLHIFLNNNEINRANACMVCKIIVYTKICINVHEDPHKTHMPLKSSMIGTQKRPQFWIPGVKVECAISWCRWHSSWRPKCVEAFGSHSFRVTKKGVTKSS